MNKTIIGLLALIILAGGAYYVYQHGPAAQSGVQSGKHAVSWQFTSLGEDPDTHAQKTKVTLNWGGVAYEAGTYDGTCSEMDGTAGGGLSLQENEVSGAFCYFAGAGDELGVFKEGSVFVLKHGEYQEPSGEGGEFRGNLTTVVSVGK